MKQIRQILNPQRFRLLAWLSLISQVLIVVTGGVVRLTGSGLGCPTWPKCTEESLINVPEMGIHGIIEFGNRLLTFVLLIIAVATWLAIVLNRRIETVRAKKHTEYSQAESQYNARVAEARGYKEQSVYQGEAYHAAKSNEAKAISAEGLAEVEGLRQQIAALSGKGGRAMLRLEVAKQLSQGNPKFVSVNQGQGGGVEVSKTDMNQLIQQLGLLEGLVAQGSSSQTGAQRATPQSAKPATPSGAQ